MTTYLASWEACRYFFAALWQVEYDKPVSCRQRKGTLNTARYLEIFNEFVDQLDDDELRNGYFQQDGATCHTSNESIAEIESFFDDRIISKALWQPRSPDLSPPDFFLWGALKGKAYANKPRTVQELENNIRREIAAISEDVLQATFANMKRRVQPCLDSGGEHFQHLL